MPGALDLPESHPLRAAHKKCRRNRAEIERSQKCGCFYCRRIFSGDRIVDWIHTNEQTALCPFCSVDSVIGDNSGYAITTEFLEQMHEVWFRSVRPWPGDESGGMTG
jgi:hypothetical protein